MNRNQCPRCAQLETALNEAIEHLEYLEPERFDDAEHKQNWIAFMNNLNAVLKGAKS